MNFIIRPKVLTVSDYLLTNYSTPRTVREIANALKLRYTTTFEIVKGMAEGGILTKGKRSRAHEYKLDFDSASTYSFLQLLNNLNLRREKPFKPNKDVKDINFMLRYNGKRIAISQKKKGAQAGLHYISEGDLKRNVQRKPAILKDIVVYRGFKNYYLFLKNLAEAGLRTPS